MRQRKRDDEPDITHDTSLQRLSWDNIRDVFTILKQQGLLGPLSSAALTIAYANLQREYQHGGSAAFRQKWTRDDWYSAIIQSFPDLSPLEVVAVFRTFPTNANFFHVFIAFMVWSMASPITINNWSRIKMERDGYFMVVYYAFAVRSYTIFNADPDQGNNWEHVTDSVYAEKNVGLIRHWDYDDETPSVMQKQISNDVVSFFYQALQEGWRFAHYVAREAPANVQASITTDCAHCGTPQPERACGNGCGTLYCNDNCANAHWFGEAAHFEYCGKKWAQKVHLKKGSMTQAAHRHHESVSEYRRELRADIHRKDGKHKYSAHARHQEQFLENVAKK
jgi:hypothetical protein